MTAGAFAFAAALFAWGPVAAPPEPAVPETTQVAPPVPEAPPPPSPPAAAAPPPIATPIIAKAPLDVRARPVLVATPVAHREPYKPMHKQWAFWAIVGGFAAATITLTILATRPQPEAYRGNAPPYYMPFP